MKLDRIIIAVAVCAFVAAAVVGAVKWRRSAPPSTTPESVPGTVSLLVVGLEGLEPSVVDRMVAAGRLPNLSRLLKEGASAEFPSLGKGVDRRISWTSLVTGVPPERQGIGAQVASPRGGTVAAPLVPASRTVDTVWTLLSKAGVRVAVLGWPGTWPVEQVNGLMVGPYGSYVLERAHGGRTVDAVHPSEAYAAVDTLVRAPTEFGRRDLARFVKEDSTLGLEALIGQNLETLTNAMAEPVTMVALARHAVADPGATAVFVYLGGVDLVSQRFWHYANPESVLPALKDAKARALFDEQVEALSGTIDLYYEYVDEVLGELIGTATEGATVAVVTDHGYAGIELDSSGNPMIGTSMHSARGFLILHGPGVAPGVRVTDAGFLDVAPTVMKAAGIEAPATVEGKVIPGMTRS